MNGPSKSECNITLCWKSLSEISNLTYWAHLQFTKKMSCCEYYTSHFSQGNTTFSRTILSIMTLSVMRLSIMDLIPTLSIKDTQHKWQCHYDTQHNDIWRKNWMSICLVSLFSYCYAQHHYANCRYFECRYTECRCVEGH